MVRGLAFCFSDGDCRKRAENGPKTGRKRAKNRTFSNHSFLYKSPLFKDYTADWFDYGNCLYIKSHLIRGFTYSRLTETKGAFWNRLYI
jgi:hypothetical protein